MSATLFHVCLGNHLRLASVPDIYRCEPGWKWNPGVLPDFDFWCVLAGRGTLCVDGVRLPVGAGRCFILRPGQRVWGRQDPRRRLQVFYGHFTFAGLDDASVARALQWMPAHGVQIEGVATLQAQAREITAAARGRDLWGRVQAVLLVRRFMLTLAGLVQRRTAAPGYGDAVIDAVAAKIDEDPAEDWDLDQLAREAGLSRAQFNRRFARATGLPPRRYCIRRKMERAQWLLEVGGLSVAATAEALGYEDIFYFSRQFRAETGQRARDLRPRKQPPANATVSRR